MVKKYYRSISKGNFSFHSSVFFGKRFSIESDISNNKILLKKGVNFRKNCIVRIEKNSSITIDENTFFNNGCSINIQSGLQIGRDCLFGESVKLYDHNHNYKTPGIVISSQGYTSGPIIIGDNCWIGSNVVILKNVIIGDNVVIGAGCIIHQSIPSGKVIVNSQHLLEL